MWRNNVDNLVYCCLWTIKCHKNHCIGVKTSYFDCSFLRLCCAFIMISLNIIKEFYNVSKSLTELKSQISKTLLLKLQTTYYKILIWILQIYIFVWKRFIKVDILLALRKVSNHLSFFFTKHLTIWKRFRSVYIRIIQIVFYEYTK